MYWEYSLYAVPAILVTGLVAWLYLKWKGRAEETSSRALFLGTAAAILIALLVPALARLLYHRAGFSVLVSVAAAFLCLALVTVAAFNLVSFIGRRKLEEKEKASGFQESFQQAAAGSAAGDQGYAPMPSEAPESIDGLERTDSISPMDSTNLIDSTDHIDHLSHTGSTDVLFRTEPIMVDTLHNIDKIGVEEHLPRENVDDLLDAAMDYKIRGDLPEAISCYRKALAYIQDKDLLTLVVIDLCGLAKMIKDTRTIQEVLESGLGKMLDFGIKAEIMNNI